MARCQLWGHRLLQMCRWFHGLAFRAKHSHLLRFKCWMVFSNWIVISYPKPRKVFCPPIGYQSNISYKNDPCNVERCGQTTGDYIKSKTPPPYWVYLRWAAARHRIPYQMYWIRILADWWKLDVPYQRTPISNRIPIPPSHSSFWWNQQRRLPETNLPLRLKAKRKHVFVLSTTIVQGLCWVYREGMGKCSGQPRVGLKKSKSVARRNSNWPTRNSVQVCVLKMTFYFAMDDRNVKNAVHLYKCTVIFSSKISANTHCDTRLKISYVPQEKEPPPGWDSLASFSFRVASTPRLAQSCLSFPQQPSQNTMKLQHLQLLWQGCANIHHILVCSQLTAPL